MSQKSEDGSGKKGSYELEMIVTPQDLHPDHSGEERRRLPRLSLGSEQFRLSRTGKIYSVVDLSERGMAFLLLDEREIPSFPVGTLVEGMLNLRRVKYPIRARVRNLMGDRIGCEFQEPDVDFSEALLGYLDPAALGLRLKAIPSTEPNTLWYHGPSGTDLIFRSRGSGEGSEIFQSFILYIFDCYIQWDADYGVRTGKVRVASDRSKTLGVVRLETLLLEEDRLKDPVKLRIAKTLILSSNISLDLKNRCVRQLHESAASVKA